MADYRGKVAIVTGGRERHRSWHPAGRLGEPDEVAALVSFLGSDEAKFITGAGYLIDGAYTAQ